MTTTWDLYDGVTIPEEGNFPSMTGVIIYKDGDQIGVRLTLDSEGMGDHSGTVNGIQYFECPVNSGVLTTTDKVEKRRLTFSEEAMIRAMLQPKPAFAPVPASIPLSGLSPAALARIAQLNQRMQANQNQPAATPQKAKPNLLPPTPKLSAPPIPRRNSSSAEPPLEDESDSEVSRPQRPEQRLSRLELLRQKKEAIRQKKLALQGKTNDKKQQPPSQPEPSRSSLQTQTTDMQHQTEPSEPMETEPTPSPVKAPTQPAEHQNAPTTPTMIAYPVENTNIVVTDETASVRSKNSKGSKASKASRDSLEQLWISELRHESPPAAAKYESDDEDNDDEDDDNHVKQIMPPELDQPPLEHVEHANDDHMLDGDEEDASFDGMDGEQTKRPPMGRGGSLTRLQELRQKKRLLEALPASINTAAPSQDVEISLEHARSNSPPTVLVSGQPANNLATMAAASAAILNRGDEDSAHSSRASTLSTELSEMDVEQDVQHSVPTAFQESLTRKTEAIGSLPSQEDQKQQQQHQQQNQQEGANTISKAIEPQSAQEESPPKQSKASHKRRRMLGLGFLPGTKRQQKRRDTGDRKGHE